MRSFTKWHLWHQNTIPLMHRDYLVGNRWYFVPFFVFCTESALLGLRFIPESVFYAQSVVRSPQSRTLVALCVCQPGKGVFFCSSFWAGTCQKVFPFEPDHSIKAQFSLGARINVPSSPLWLQGREGRRWPMNSFTQEFIGDLAVPPVTLMLTTICSLIEEVFNKKANLKKISFHIF